MDCSIAGCTLNSIEPLVIGMQGWVHPDGNYRIFEQNTIRSFAIEAMPAGVQKTDPGPKQLARIRNNEYEFKGLVTHCETMYQPRFISNVSAWTVVTLDVGVLCFASHTDFQAGQWLAGKARIEIDCFTYFEKVAPHKPSFPPIIYEWKILKIEQGIEDMADEDTEIPISLEEVQDTSDYKPLNRLFLMHCELVGGPSPLRKQTAMEKLLGIEAQP